jgi:serine/threonine-protein kinase RsbW
MQDDKNIELHIPSVPGFEKVAMETAASVAEKMGFSVDRVKDLKTAVSEACLNAIEHGNKMDTSTKVGITLTIEKSKLQVAVKDEGKGIGHIKAPDIDEKIEGKDETP